MHHDAGRLDDPSLFTGAPVGAVISGLPLLSMSPKKKMAILSGAFTYLRPGGALYQFTYGPFCPVPLSILNRLGLQAECMGRTIANLPPAAAYRITRREQRC